MNDFEVDPHLERLIEAHPLLFRGKEPAVSSHVLAGWFGLLRKLCSDIESTLGPELCIEFEVRQIKGKFGTLRFYYRLSEREDLHIDMISPASVEHVVLHPSASGGVDRKEIRVRELVRGACSASGNTCATCGRATRLRDVSGYYTTLCDQHFAEAQAERALRNVEIRGVDDFDWRRRGSLIDRGLTRAQTEVLAQCFVPLAA